MLTRTDSRMREYTALPLFAGFSDSDLRQVSRAATRLSAEAGTVLLRQGERGRQFVIVLGGTAEVWRDGQPIDEIGAGGYFGEIALIRDVPRTATATARTDVVLYALEREDFLAAVTGHAPSASAAEQVASARLGSIPTTGAGLPA